MNRPLLACSMGDPAGIGPDVLLRAAREATGFGCLIVGDRETFFARAERPPEVVASVGEAAADLAAGTRGPWLLPVGDLPSPPVPGEPRSIDSLAALEALQTAAGLTATGQAAGLVTAPVNKAGVAAHAPGFRGHTEFLASLEGSGAPIMLFAAPRDDSDRGADIALLTRHMPLATALSLVRRDTVEAALRQLHRAWAATFGSNPVIGLAALNPHAGENGRLGGEEVRVLAPARRACVHDGLDVRGPFAADSIFLRGELDVILALYHDQGTIMAKRAPWPTVNLTLGLPYIRTSPDHGTAYDLAGTDRADHRPMLEAMRLAAWLAARRDHDASGC